MLRNELETRITMEDVVIKQYLCMVTYKGRDMSPAWLSHEEMVRFIKCDDSQDYYHMGQQRDVVTGTKEVTSLVRVVRNLTEEEEGQALLDEITELRELGILLF